MAKKTKIKLSHTARGFVIGEFQDRGGNSCSIQESSLATEACIWLGCDANVIETMTDQGWVTRELTANELIHDRMELTQAGAAALIPLLQHFVETGYLPQPKEKK